MNYSFTYKGALKVRIQDLDFSHIPNLESKSQWKKMVKKGLVCCENKTANLSTWVLPNYSITILWSNIEVTSSKPFLLDLEVVYEDDYLAVVVKPPGLPTSGNVFKSLQNALSHNLKISNEMKVGDTFQTCHRLDYSTSGLVLVSKTKKCRIILGRNFENQNIKKYYFAIVQGKLNGESGIWNSKIDGKEAWSEFKVLKTIPSLKNKFLTGVQLYPKTGRTHQLRIHSSCHGHPIVGDTKYGNETNILKGKGLFLCAFKMEFIHPITNQLIKVEIEVPNKFSKLLMNEERRFLKYRE